MASAGDFRPSILIRNSNPPAGTAVLGVFAPGTRRTLVSISDGTSNTIMFMESAGGFVTGETWTLESWANATWWSAFGTCPQAGGNGNCNNSPEGRGKGWGLTGSFHSGDIVQAVQADGSVRGYRTGAIDFLSMAYLVGVADGQTGGQITGVD
jgi:hypothetical protein